MNRNPAVIVLVIVALVGAVVMVMRRDDGPQFEQGYYYDLTSRDLFVAEYDQQSSVISPTGGTGVRAHVFSCSTCDDEASQFVGRLERYSDEAEQLLDQLATVSDPQKRNELNAQIAQEITIALPRDASEDLQWYAVESADGMRVMEHAAQQCNAEGGQLQVCSP